VNGEIKGKWLFDNECEHEETKRFSHSRFESKHNARMKKFWKTLGKSKKFLEEKREIRDFFFTVKVKTILKQWIDREINKSIELVDSDGNVLHKYK
jgi:hypothetical protein